MGKKKKGGKGKKEKDEGGLPPPPNLDSYTEGAREALLTFKIQGKEESIQQYEEEAGEFKDNNYKQKGKNYELKTVQKGYRKALFQQAMQYEHDQAGKEEVSQEMVEEALWQKLQLARDIDADLQDLEDRIVAVGQQLEMERKELETWQNYKENTAQAEEEYIKRMRSQMKEMKEKEVQAENEQDIKLSAAKLEIDAKWQRKMERVKDAVSEKLLNSLDREGQAELVDNGWLKREIKVVSERVSELRRDVDQLELRNLHLLEEMQKEQLEELEFSVGLLQASTGQTRQSHTATDHGIPSLPSLVDVSKNTGTRGVAGRLGQMERQLLNVEGHVAPLVLPPDSTHLPPLAQQSRSHSALPPCTSWPITSDMLHSIT